MLFHPSALQNRYPKVNKWSICTGEQHQRPFYIHCAPKKKKMTIFFLQKYKVNKVLIFSQGTREQYKGIKIDTWCAYLYHSPSSHAMSCTILALNLGTQFHFHASAHLDGLRSIDKTHHQTENVPPLLFTSLQKDYSRPQPIFVIDFKVLFFCQKLWWCMVTSLL